MAAAKGFFARVAVLCALQLGLIVSLHAENLVSLQTGRLAPLREAGEITHVLNVDQRLIAIGPDATWMLDEKQQAWTRTRWRPAGQILSVATAGHGAILLLGKGADPVAERVEQLSLVDGELASRALPPLPIPLAEAQGAQLGESLFVAGRGKNGAWQVLAIDPAAPAPGWIEHANRPAGEHKLTSMVGQKSGLYLTFGPTHGQSERLLRWTASDGWKELADVPGLIVKGTARAIGQAHVLYLLSASAAAGPVQRLASFHTITGSWAVLEERPGSAARLGTGWGDGILWQRPAADGAVELAKEFAKEFAFAQIEPNKPLLKWLDWIVIGVYLTAMLGIGLYFYLRQKRNSTSDFFVGGRTIPFWAAGVSLYAANTSSISYIAIPAKSFETNWQYLTNNLVAVLGLMFVAAWVVPLLRRLDLMSVFQYLETRFHPVIRTLASALFMAVQIGSRMSVILFLPSLAIATMTGIGVEWSIAIMGVFTIIYTAMGGMKAVVWTDVVQLVVKMGGIFFAIGFIIYLLDGGVVELLRVASAEDKTKLFDFSFDLTKATVWGFVFLVLFDVVLTFPKDQVLMQRVLSTKSDRDAGRSIWTLAAIMIPGGFLFYMVGTALYVFYKAHPERMNPLLTIDATFPLFIAAELPMGVRGLIIAGILAAAMATLSSIMNSVATLASVDFYERRVQQPDPKASVRFAEWMTVVTGVAGMGVALLLSRYDIHSLFDISIELAGLLGGGFAGAYTLGMFTRRANWQGVAIGVAVSITTTTLAWSMNLVHPYFYLAISILVCIVVGYLASWFFPAPPPQSLVGLTIHEPKVTAPAVQPLVSPAPEVATD